MEIIMGKDSWLIFHKKPFRISAQVKKGVRRSLTLSSLSYLFCIQYSQLDFTRRVYSKILCIAALM